MSKKYCFVNKPDNIIPESLSTFILEKSKALDFHKNQDNYSPTPLYELPQLAKNLGVGKIYIKDESQRMGLNAFKGVGAYYAIQKIIDKNPGATTLCTATDGNHGRAVARSAREAGIKAIVIVPKGTTDERIIAIQNEGAKVRVIDGSYDAACRLASDLSIEKGWELVQDTASSGYERIPAYIMAGYLTIFQEMEDSINRVPDSDIDLVIVQAGVGSFAAACTWYYINRYAKKRPSILITEPYESDGVIYSLEMDRVATSLSASNSLMAGLNCNTPSTSAFEILKHGADYAMRITDDHSIAAIRTLYYPHGDDKKVCSGESGAAGLAGLIALLNDPEYADLKKISGIGTDTRVLLINTEGPTDQKSFKNIVRE